MMKNVAIVGAGPSGLVAAKELLQEGHEVTCFERDTGLGGVFRYRESPERPGVWRTCRLTSSMLVTFFSDYFPNWQTDEPFQHRHLTHEEYIDYLTGYAREFGVLERIHFDHEVIDARRNETGWSVTVQGPNVTLMRDFDTLVVCSGVHSEPYIPPLPGLEMFQGQILHAAHYRGPESIEGSSALFVGAGESGSEVLAEAAPTLDRAYLSLRRGVYVLPRYVNGVPNDYNGTRLLYSLPDFMARRTDDAAKEVRRRLKRWFFPIWVLRKLMINGRDFLLPRQVAPADTNSRDSKVYRLIVHLRQIARGNLFESFATKSEAFVEAIVDGTCELRESIRRFTPSGVLFTDGSAEVVQTVVLCTGYRPAEAPFLKAPVDLQALYKNCVSPEHGTSLAFIGFLRPPVGAIPPMAEIQARWFAQLTSGRIQLPEADAMRSEVDREIASSASYFRHVHDRLPHMVDFSTYMDDLAGKIGAKPSVWRLLREPRLAYQLHAGPFCGTQFRLFGPHSRFAMAKRVLMHARSPTHAFRFLDFGLAELARLLRLKQYQARLSIIGPTYRSEDENVH
ncbi:MAG: FAD-dependent oxidoreductase [Pseudomonadota bacterium]